MMSIGDVFLYTGVASFVVLVMRRTLRGEPASASCGCRCTGGSTFRSAAPASPFRAASVVVLGLQQRGRELHGDRGALARGALHVEGPATDLSAFAHHRHAEVALGPRRGGVEPDPVVAELQLDRVVVLTDR